jgi:hypothetical protein
MITCKFAGELGNNLFQLATLLSLSKSHNYEYVIPSTREFWNACNNDTLEFNRLFDYNFNYGSSPSPEYVHPDMQEPPNHTFRYTPIPTLPDGTCIRGYFQCDRYFNDIAIELKTKYFRIKQTLINEILSKYGDLSHTATLHVRHGGDRLQPCVYGRSFSQFNSEYYSKSVKFLKESYQVDNVILISDDIGWCKENIKIPNIHFVENTTNIEDFTLYSLCRYNVIGNSTYSWWASYLNLNHDVHRIAFPPSKYFMKSSHLSHIDVTDLYDGMNCHIIDDQQTFTFS